MEAAGLSGVECARKYDYYSFDLRRKSLKACCKALSRETPSTLSEDLAQIISDRKAMAAGERIASCTECWQIEEAGGTSYRRFSSHNPGHPLAKDLHQPWLVEFVLSNICNLKCIYCDSKSSSQWAASGAAPLSGVLTETIKKQVVEWWDGIGQFNLVGGEPILTPETAATLSFLLETAAAKNDGRPRGISIVTNLAVKPEVFRRFLEKLIPLTRWFEVELIVSAEALGERFEFIRDGSVFETFLENFHRLLDTREIQLSVISTLNVLAIGTYDEFLEYFLNMIASKERSLHLFYNEVVSPEALTPRGFPLDLMERKAAAFRALDSFPKNLWRAPTETENFRKKLSDVYDSAGKANAAPSLRSFLNRSESGRLNRRDWRNVFPELVEPMDRPAAIDWNSLNQAALNDFADSLRDFGTVSIRNAPVSPSNLKRLAEVQEKIFSLPNEIKKRGEPSEGPSVTGYIPFGVESAGAGQPPDPKEAWHISFSGKHTNLWPDETLELKAVADSLSAELDSFAASLMQMVGRAFGIEEHTRELIADPDSILRLVRYGGGADQLAGAHRDIGLLTLVLHQSHSGYETLKDGRWVTVPPHADQILVSAGQMLEFISNKEILAPTHRVRRASDAGEFRYFAGYFVHPAPKANLQSRDRRLTSAEMLEERFADMNVAKEYPL